VHETKILQTPIKTQNPKTYLAFGAYATIKKNTQNLN